MSCRVVDLGGGATGFVRASRAKSKSTCAFCKVRETQYLCDWPLTGPKTGQTCDAKLCESCATRIADNTDICPSHKREGERRLAAERDAEAWLDALRQETASSTASQDAAVPWSVLPDDPPVSALAKEMRPRTDERTLDQRTLDLARDEAILLSQRKDAVRGAPCTRCGGEVIINRGWAACVKRQRDGGCGRVWNHEEAKRIEAELRLAFTADEAHETRDAELRARADNATMREKVEHVREARQTREHRCHWPGCEAKVPPAKWGCRAHWFALPHSIRDRIWRAYAPGQENTLTPSSEYLKAADEAQMWIRSHLASPVPHELEGSRSPSILPSPSDSGRQLALEVGSPPGPSDARHAAYARFAADVGRDVKPENATPSHAPVVEAVGRWMREDPARVEYGAAVERARNRDAERARLRDAERDADAAVGSYPWNENE